MTKFSATLLTTLFLTSILTANVFQTGTPEEIVEVIETLVKKKSSDKNSVNQLIQTLKNPDADIRSRERAAWALGELRAQSAVPALIEAAGHKGLLIRSAALDALLRIRSKTALSVITKIAESDPILSLRQRATLGLGLLKSDAAIPALVKLSSDPSTDIQGAAALSMASLHSKKNDFSEVLKEMAKEVDPHVKGRARVGLDIVSRKNKEVRQHLKSEDMDVRLFAANYFRTQGASADTNALKEAMNGEAQADVLYELGESLKAIKRRAEAAAKATAPKAN